MIIKSVHRLLLSGGFISAVSPHRWIATLTLYITRKGRFDCHGGTILHTYLIVLLVLLGVIIITLCVVVYVSAQGKSCSFFFRSNTACLYSSPLVCGDV